MKNAFLIKNRYIIKKIYSVLCILFLFQLTSCGLNVNYKSDRFGNAPVAGGTKEGNKYKEAKSYYPVWNMKTMEETGKELDPIYHASANFYNDMNYDIAKNYLEGYNSMLNTNIKQLEDSLQNGDFDISSTDIVEKMDIGQVRAYPPVNNIIMVHKLNNEKQEIAVPSYLEEYVNDFFKTTDIDTEKKQSDMIDNNQITSMNQDIKDYKNFSNEEKRDKYVEKQLAFTNAFEGAKKEKYSEFFIE